MIYTCTLNPSLDYYMEFKQVIEEKKTNRSQLEYYEAGGKGINVSIVLSNLMIPSRAFGFLGGFTKDFYISLLEKYEYLQPAFTYINGHTRINVKASTDRSNVDLNSAGPTITPEDMKHLKSRVDRLDENDIFVYSGNTPDYLQRSAEELIDICSNNKVRVVLDTNAALIERCLQHQPYLVCPSVEDLEIMVGSACDTEEKIIAAAAKCVEWGAKNVMVYRGESPAIMAVENKVYRVQPIKKDGVLLDTVGTQDAMVAGFVMSSLRTPNVVECFRYANCCKEATIFSKSLEIRDRINELYDELTVEEV
ncbi:MAG: 1-phosphofructokinase [Anaerorhabdus sp.]